MSTGRFLKREQVAEELNISKAQLYALLRRGDMRHIKVGGRGLYRIGRPISRTTSHRPTRRPRRGSRSIRSTRTREVGSFLTLVVQCLAQGLRVLAMRPNRRPTVVNHLDVGRVLTSAARKPNLRYVAPGCHRSVIR
jgi:excisionase family DNA binding protein